MEEGKGRRVEWGVGGGREREEGKRPMKFEWGTGEHFECLEVGKKFDWGTGKFPSKVSWLWFYAACIPNMVLYVTCVVLLFSVPILRHILYQMKKLSD